MHTSDDGGLKMMPFRYELHCHTKEGSTCATLSAEETVALYHRIGYSGLCVTDHFSGSTPLPDDTPWDERVEFHYDIYQKARTSGEKLGISVFFGIEYSLAPDVERLTKVTGNDFIFLNISREWLKGNKAAFSGRPEALFAKIREAGGLVIHAHPFYEAYWVECIRLYPGSVDAIEALNTGCTDFINDNAKSYARAYGLLEVGGSDCHSADNACFSGVETDVPCLTADALAREIREKRARVIPSFTI